ncbi:MAG: phosphatidylserine decarboxylase [Acidobacteriota bacterium]
MAFSVAKEGFWVSAGTVTLSSLLLATWFNWLGIVIFFFFLFELFFFRDPDRESKKMEEGNILSPADGTIISIEDGKISIFMSLFDVHINRAPAAGEVEDVIYQRGGFKVAFHEKAPLENERNTVILKSRAGTLSLTQVAGVVARRIVCNVRKGDRLRAGDRIGMIKFGSRVDLQLPIDAKMNVSRGDRVKAGLCSIATVERKERS